MNITAAQVNELRKITGAGMMDCKNALVESEGDMEKAIDVLRKKGQKVAAKRADRDATEGVIVAKNNSDATYAALVMVNCETDFVAKDAGFNYFAAGHYATEVFGVQELGKKLKAHYKDQLEVEFIDIPNEL